MISLDRDCNRIEDKVVRDEWDLKNCNHLDIEGPPSVSRDRSARSDPSFNRAGTRRQETTFASTWRTLKILR